MPSNIVLYNLITTNNLSLARRKKGGIKCTVSASSTRFRKKRADLLEICELIRDNRSLELERIPIETLYQDRIYNTFNFRIFCPKCWKCWTGLYIADSSYSWSSEVVDWSDSTSSLVHSWSQEHICQREAEEILPDTCTVFRKPTLHQRSRR